MIRDGRDVVCSLLERGWLRADRGGADDARAALRRTRPLLGRAGAARGVRAGERGAARSLGVAPVRRLPRARFRSGRVELRYEALVESPHAEADRIAESARLEAEPLRRAFAEVHGSSVGRWRRDLTPEQIADVEAEAGGLLAELGYA